ncbi:MAG: hypothetical protein KatS3mg016_1775 [Fimbriimonadales bacterium]|nr:MAG: hypothetical protein KatS3mg016_1775 [Fimbriimonadales bacterium]
MPITIEDLNDLKRLLEEHPDWQETLARALLTPKTLLKIFKSDPELQAILRAVILGEEFLELPALTREAIQRLGALESVTGDLVQRTGALEETSRDTVQRLGALEETSRDTVRRLGALEETSRDTVQRLGALEETSRDTVQRLGALEETSRDTVQRLGALEETSRDTVQRLGALEETSRDTVQRLGALEETSRDTVQRLGALEETSRDTVQRLGALEETSRDTVRRLGALEAEVRDLKETSRQTIERLDRLEASHRGLEGRLAGEQYEKRILRSAWRLFNGGDGGSPEDRAVAERLREWLSANRALVARIHEEDDPYLSDLIWWKEGRVAVVEVSLKVNGVDVQRAHARAQTLREAGADAFPLVIGNEWAHPESRDLAEQLQVAWKVGDDISQGYINFRRMGD